MFSSLTFQNFRGFENLHLDGLKRVNLVVGRNNSGKTSLLEGIASVQFRNRQDLAQIMDVDTASEAYASALAEEGSRILKLAMIFEACRWAANPSRDCSLVPRDTLELAIAHGRYCLNAGREMDAIGRRGETRNAADAILANVRMEWGALAKGGAIELNRTQLTHRFASTPGRNNAMTPARLYHEIIPDLVRRGLAMQLPKAGKLQAYLFDASEVQKAEL